MKDTQLNISIRGYAKVPRNYKLSYIHFYVYLLTYTFKSASTCIFMFELNLTMYILIDPDKK
jgi:hypothetical protein